MASYVTQAELRAFGITDPKAEELSEQASGIIDAHLFLPYNDDGRKFPREEDADKGIPADDEVPSAVKYATMEQTLYMLQEGMDHIRRGGQSSIYQAQGGATETKENVEKPLLAPLAKLHLRPFLGRVGFGPSTSTGVWVY